MRDEYDFSEAERGPVVETPEGEVRITIRLDEDAVQWFKARVDAEGGGDFQAMINSALRDYVEHQQEGVLLCVEDGVRVFTGEPTGDLGSAVEDQRRERTLKLSWIR
ncbi:MAG TPA: BrnA antitoxin family protein [Thermoanaerobaculia bacterium]|nr:BrnA antitoxin family protein [Thermoanaerobaculia bacterium]